MQHQKREATAETTSWYRRRYHNRRRYRHHHRHRRRHRRRHRHHIGSIMSRCRLAPSAPCPRRDIIAWRSSACRRTMSYGSLTVGDAQAHWDPLGASTADVHVGLADDHGTATKGLADNLLDSCGASQAQSSASLVELEVLSCTEHSRALWAGLENRMLQPHAFATTKWPHAAPHEADAYF